jgi:mRNA interferase RelE/StbE
LRISRLEDVSLGESSEKMYEVILSDRASNYYEKLPSNTQRRINKAIDSIEENPFAGSNIKRLTGKFEGLYRYRIGNIRIVNQVVKSEMKVAIVEIGTRGGIYR